MSIVKYTVQHARSDYQQAEIVIEKAVREIEQIIARAAKDGKRKVEVHSLNNNNEFVHYHLPTHTPLSLLPASTAIVNAFTIAGYRCGFERDEGYIPAAYIGECNQEQYRQHRWVLTFYWG